MNILVILGIAVSTLAASQATTLVVEVKNVPSVEGRLQCGLFASKRGFPSDGKRALRRVEVVLRDHAPVCVFKGIVPGTYAVAVRHDANGNDRLDTNLFGMPTEAYGASNNKLSALSPPSWEDSRFEISATPTHRIIVELDD